MRLQKITAIETEYSELYFRGGSLSNGLICLKSGETVSFNTYFNCFSYTKYLKYTSVNQVSFSCKIEGEARASLCVFDGQNEVVLCSDTVKDGTVSLSASLSTLPQRAILYPVITAVSDATASDGFYSCENAEPCHIDCAIAICTFKREESTLNNLKILSDADFSFVNKIFVIDNGQTLNASQHSSDLISVLPNKNFGGSGGFTRGIMEAHRGGHTHVILMDDDVVIFPEAIERITVFMSLLLPEYKNAHFSAAMLPLSKMHMQYEMGARWNGHRIQSFKPDADVLNPTELVNNLDEDPVEYGAWWCFCFPLSDVDSFGLPLPLFIKFDDVEYGMRTCKGAPIVTMNGVCVAHEDFDRKYSMHLDYYALRNQLITLACHKKQTRLGAIARLWKCTLRQTFLYRYDTLGLQYKAFCDFLKGADFLISTNEEDLNKHIMSITKKPVPLSSVPQWENTMRQSFAPKKQGAFSMLLKTLTLGGHLIPSCFLSKKACAFPLPDADIFSCHGKKTTIQYQLGSDDGYVYKRSVKRFFKCFFKSIGMSFKLLFTYGKAKKSYLKNKDYLASFDFWQKHLEI